MVVAGLVQDLQRPMFYIVARSEHARQTHDELQLWLRPNEPTTARPSDRTTARSNEPTTVPLYYFADPDPLPYERVAWSRETRGISKFMRPKA
jgi:hypothetical protein